MKKVCIADEFHIHKRNFPSLFEKFASADSKVKVLLPKSHDCFRLITAIGCYDDLEERTSAILARYIRSQAEEYSLLTADELFDISIYSLKLWPLCRSELMAYLLTRDNWQQEVMLKDDRAVFDKAFEENHSDLVMNIAMANFWLNHWFDLRRDIFENERCFVFSGSMTYTRTLMELLRRSPTKCMVLESTFTGNDYICEELYHPVANNLGVKYENVRVSRRIEEFELPDQYDREVVKARNKVLSAKNKNVKQPPDSALPTFPHDAELILIVGQVVNDFSLIEEGFPYVGSIPVYKELITKLLDETEHNIVFKAHPWENKKVHVGSAKTFDALVEFAGSLPVEKRARLLLVEDCNIYGLIEQSSYFVTICSQASIEAALLGMKPFVLGKSFYSSAGFTFACDDVGALVETVKSESGVLDLEGYKAFDRYLVDLFQFGTVSCFKSGVGRLGKVTEVHTGLNQMTPIKAEMELGRTRLSQKRDASLWSGVVRKKTPFPDAADPKEVLSSIAFNIELPDKMEAGSSAFDVVVEAFNNGDFVVPKAVGAKEFHLSYHIFDEAGGRYCWNGLQTHLNEDIHQEFVGAMMFEPPADPGKYKVKPALVLPGVCWIEGDQEWEITVV